jgi:hypothetical protein
MFFPAKPWAEDVVQVMECLPSKHEALNSNPSTYNPSFLQKPDWLLFTVIASWAGRVSMSMTALEGYQCQ